MIQDITEEKELEQMRTEFVSMAAHELRTPLTSMRGYLSVFMNENALKLNPEQNMFLKRIQVSTDQLMVLVENLLNISRIEKGAVSLHLESIAWNDLVRSVITNFEMRVKEKNISLAFIAHEDFNPLVIV